MTSSQRTSLQNGSQKLQGLPSNWFDFRSSRVSECGGPFRFVFVGESRNVYPFQRSLLEIPVVSSSHACTNRIFVGVSYRTFPCILAGRRCWGRDPATPHPPPPPGFQDRLNLINQTPPPPRPFGVWHAPGAAAPWLQLPMHFPKVESALRRCTSQNEQEGNLTNVSSL